MKTRKATRMSLDELARTMPVLSETTQQLCLGGAWYYYPDGTLMMSAGESDAIYVYQDGNNIPLSEASSTAIRNVVGTQCLDVMGYSGQIGFISSGDEHAAFDSNGNFYINPNAGYSIDSFSELRATLYHEKYHYNNFITSGTIESGSAAEIAAIQNQINCAEYTTTSYAYKQTVASYWYMQVNDPGQKAEIANACGVKASDF